MLTRSGPPHRVVTGAGLVGGEFLGQMSLPHLMSIVAGSPTLAMMKLPVPFSLILGASVSMSGPSLDGSRPGAERFTTRRFVAMQRRRRKGCMSGSVPSRHKSTFRSRVRNWGLTGLVYAHCERGPRESSGKAGPFRFAVVFFARRNPARILPCGLPAIHEPAALEVPALKQVQVARLRARKAPTAASEIGLTIWVVRAEPARAIRNNRRIKSDNALPDRAAIGLDG